MYPYCFLQSFSWVFALEMTRKQQKGKFGGVNDERLTGIGKGREILNWSRGDKTRNTSIGGVCQSNVYINKEESTRGTGESNYTNKG